MADRQRQYWLHRITGGSYALPVAWQLLHKKDANEHYLSIGWSDLSYDGLVKDIQDENWDEVRGWFESEKYTLSYSAWCLVRFVKDMQPGDYVVVPSWGTFSVYEIADSIVFTNESCSNIHFEDWNGKIPQMKDSYLRDENGNTIDLGFYRRVIPIEVDIPRAEYAEAALISRMKIRQTNAGINDLENEIIEAIKAFQAKKPLNLKSNILENAIKSTFEQIKKILDPDKFERLIEWYLISLGASKVETPAKNGSPTVMGDADKVAYFDKLKLAIMVQAKRHDNTTDEWAVQQVKAYYKNNSVSDDYSTVLWVVSTCDQFSEDAISLAKSNDVRLINGREFTQLILENGLNGMEL